METMKFAPEFLNKLGIDYLSGHLGGTVADVSPGMVRTMIQVKKSVLAPNGHLHAGNVVSLADTCAGYGCDLCYTHRARS